MNKIIYFIFVFLVFSKIQPLQAQNQSFSGRYVFSGDNYYETITLKENGAFEYTMRGHFLIDTIRGNWQVKGQELILDSSPQRDRMLVEESRDQTYTGFRFYVRSKSGMLIHYTLYTINASNDTNVLEDQWQKTELKNNSIQSFYLVDTKGLASPLYKIKNPAINTFTIYFEIQRVFENERWQISDKGINPKNASGINQKYHLTKG